VVSQLDLNRVLGKTLTFTDSRRFGSCSFSLSYRRELGNNTQLVRMIMNDLVRTFYQGGSMTARAPVMLAALIVALTIAAPRPALAQMKRIGGVSGTGTDDCAVNASMHSTIVRTGLPWFLLQPANTPIDYGPQDNAFQCYIDNGMHIYYSLNYAPDWAGGHGDCEGDNSFNCHMPDLNAWSAFVSDVISHYTQKGWIDKMTFGIWNEPDGRFLTGCSDKVACWGQLWQSAANARNAVNPSARLAGPEMGRIDGALDQALSYMSSNIQPQDVISTHWYSTTSEWIEYWVTTVKQKAGGRETWITESSVDDCNDASQANRIDWIMRYFAWWQSKADAYIYYQVVSGDAPGCIDVRNRPSFDALKRWADFLTPPGAPVSVGSNQGLLPDQSVTSPNGQYTLTYQSDGNLVIVAGGGLAIWSTDTSGTCANVASMQSDGNFVVYDCNGQALWFTGTSGNGGAYLSIQDDGNLCVFSADGRGLWARF
jgi:hypothetical protein